MKLTFLGTGTSVGIPMIGCLCPTCKSLDQRDKRLRTSAHLVVNGHEIQFDIGPDFRQQMLHSQIPRVDTILLTHQHADHTSGLDEIRAMNFLQDSSIPLYAEKNVLDDLRMRFDYIFGGRNYPGLPSISLNEIYPNEIFKLGTVEILPLRIMHGKLPILGFRINNLAYITDANLIDNHTMDQLQNLDILIINALRHKVHPSHFNLEQSLTVTKQIQAKKSFLTHISHQMGLHREVEKELPDSVYLAYDGLEIKMDE